MIKPKKDISFYANWGGFFPHPQLDAALPRPLKFNAEPSPVKPLPSLLTMFTIPDDIPAEVLLSDVVGYPTNTTQIESRLNEYTTLPKLAAVCIPPSGRGLNSIPPLDRIYAFVWKMAKYLTGTYPILSVADLWELEDEIEVRFGARLTATIVLPLLYNQATQLVVLGA
jgi:hypothetical protein